MTKANNVPYDGEDKLPPALDRLAGQIRDGLKSADKHLLEACDHLAAARMLCTERGFKALLEVAGVKRSRAYELLAIADGSKTVEEVRARTAERNRRLRARKKEADVVRHVTEFSPPIFPILAALLRAQGPPSSRRGGHTVVG
jgi:hypothetical protein